MGFWLFSSKNLKNIEVAKERLLWGFRDRDAGEKFRRNWRAFIRLYNRIKPFDIVVFQVAGAGSIHAIGIVKEKYFDDQTPVWPEEREKSRVLYPWRISFSGLIFSENSFTKHFIRIENYVDGYGLGELSEHEFRTILNEIQKNINIDLNFG
ncbi:MAG: hypothetical protein QXP71_04215 [Desulfurococcaceae archaeon]